ncbi:MAG TPA: ABC transporter ATP-binding protein [Lachnospiraceae bacterium]|nr:ABC transporter ATP-binding protein [Lachnospiraceae bacterium]HCE74953.1 ABC transporter ATP-binding protein [Lachnospiraceae bacterium]HCG60705.1 ABC transporter ATP-binding protein [Lachnospiraceae bacterium]HCI84536.1 ABC transporter ATP-binding protein [Lachnospiraceae bacterium]
MCDTAIEVSDVTKVYRLYERQRDRLWETLGLDRKKTYKEKYALNHVSFRVKRGETVGIIGTNGSGKSTMLKLITGVLTPTAGSIRVDGRISALLELGAGFNMEYTGIENVYLNGAMIGFTKEEIDARLDDIISFADIGDYINQPVKSYSSGMFVRLAFAVAINIDPEILIVDEALSVGDVFFQSKCYRKFEEFRRAGKTILFVSHDLSAISRYCDRAILLNQGDLIYDGTPKEAIDLYKKVLVGQYEEKPAEQPEAADGEKREIQGIGSDSGLWKSRYPVNPSLIEYGEKNGEIVDYALLDENGLMTSNFLKGTVFTVRMKIRAHADILEPIFAFTIKNMKGIEICGTNTTMEHVPVPTMHDGDEHVVEFTQKMDLQGGEYLLSLGCTGYQDGMFRVFHRLYDVISLTVVSNRDTVGFYDMNSTCVLDPEI